MKFKVLQNLIVIPVFLNDSDTLWFILDSGVKNTILLEVPKDDTLEMKGTRTLSLGGLGMGGTIDVLHSWGNELRIPGIKAKNQDVLVVKDSLFSIASNIGFPVHGIIGHAVFKDFVVRINYPLKTISFIDPDRFSSWWKGYKVNLELIGDKPFVHVPIHFPNGEKKVYKLLLDTGAGLSAALFMDESKPFEIPTPNITGSLGTGLSGRLLGKVARVDKLQIGKHTIDNPILTFPDSQSINMKRKPAYHVGIIGVDIIKRFNVYISYQRNAMWIRRNRYFNDRFKYNTSGIDIYTPLPSLPYYEVERVRPGSVAEAQGIKPGDQLVTIDHKSAYNMSFNEVTRKLSKKPGQVLHLTINRGDSIIDFKMRMMKEL